MASLVFGRFFLRLAPLVDVFPSFPPSNAVDHEVKRVIACYLYALLPATR